MTANGTWLDQFFEGSPGPVAASVVDATALAATDTTGWLDGTQAFVQSLPDNPFILKRASTKTPNGFTVIAALGGGNWETRDQDIVGTAKIGVNSALIEDGKDFVLVPAGTTATLYTMPSPNIAVKELVTLGAHFEVTNTTGGHVGVSDRVIRVVNVGGVVQTPAGGTSDSDVTPDPTLAMDSALAGLVCKIVISGATLLCQATAPGIDVYAKVSVSGSRGLLPGTGPLPVVTSTSVSSGTGAGGTVTVLHGSNFTNATSVALCGTAASFVVNSDTQITVTSNQFFGIPNVAGNIDVGNLNGTGTLANAWTYTSSAATPFTIFGSAAKYWRAQDAVHTGSTLTNIPEAHGGTTATIGGGAPSYVASSSNWTPAQPAISFNGTSDYMTVASFAMGASKSMFGWIIFRCTDATANFRELLQYTSDSFYGMQLDTVAVGHPQLQGGGRTAPELSTNVVNAISLVTGFVEDASVGSGGKNVISLNGGTEVSQAATGASTPATGTVYVAARGGSTFFMPGEIVEFGFVPFTAGTSPSSAQKAALHAYAQQNYGTP